MQRLLQDASLELGRLDGLASINAFVRKEALLSSQIEGTQASLDEVLAFEASEKDTRRRPSGGAREVYRYIKAMNHGLSRLDQLPLSLRLIERNPSRAPGHREGERQVPRRIPQVTKLDRSPWMLIEGSHLVPPPPTEMTAALNELESYLHQDTDLPLLVKIAIVHAQFETIHPFLDGNGRVGRLLITFLLCHAKVLQRPLLYLSYFFKKRRTRVLRKTRCGSI